MIILDETKLRNGTLMMIGEDYGMKIEPYGITEEAYDEHIENIIERFRFDIDGFQEKLIEAVKNIKVELRMKK